jgi:hypothetical protein
MPRLFAADDKRLICEISGEQLDFLQELLVEEDETDRDYFVDKDTLEMLKDEGCDPAVVDALEKAVGDGEGIEVGWAR